MIPLYVSREELAEAGAKLVAQAEAAKAAIREALRDGHCTAADRAKLVKIEAAIHAQAANIAAQCAEAEAARQMKVAEAGHRHARAAAERLRFRLAMLSAPRAPGIGNRRP